MLPPAAPFYAMQLWFRNSIYTLPNKGFRKVKTVRYITIGSGNEDGNERPDFASYLSGTLLPSVSERLVELTISGHYWGSIPAGFNGKGLSFPCLKRLTLEKYIILRQDQFDWILEQPTLIGLNLYSCKIATYCLVWQSDFEDWGVNLNGWKKLADSYEEMNDPNLDSMANAPHFGELRPGWYMSDLRWSDMFDRIRQNLSQLRNFNFKCSSWRSYFEGYPEIPYPSDLHNRYYTFDHDGWGPWGLMWYWPAEEHPWTTEGDPSFADKDMPGTPVGLYERAQSADEHALKKLMEATRKRRDGK